MIDGVEGGIRGTESRVRDGWSAAFQRMAERGDDALLDADAPPLTNWDEVDWEW